MAGAMGLEPARASCVTGKSFITAARNLNLPFCFPVESGLRAYLKAAGIGVRPPRAWGRRAPAKPANEVTTGSDATMNRSFARRSIVPTEIERGARCQWLTCVSAFQLRVGLAALSQRVARGPSIRIESDQF